MAADHRSSRPQRWLNGLASAWVILGLSFAILLTLEVGYRVVRRIAHSLTKDYAAGNASPIHPYHNEPWFAAWAIRRDETLAKARYDPYRSWRMREVSFPGLHIDSAGRRLTAQPNAPHAPGEQVFFLGGSTMWGYTARDSSTIPSLVADHLARRGIRGIEVVNMGAMGYNATQEAITLMLELRQGNVPKMVILLDGINEIGPVEEGGEVGEVYKQARHAQRFEGDALVEQLLTHLTFINRLLLLAARTDRPASDAERTCDEITRNYVGLVKQIEALSEAHRFSVLFFWQPTLVRSRKQRSAWEQSLAGRNLGLQRLTAACSARMDSAMASRRDRTFFPLHSLFDQDTSSVFLDHWGHVTETGDEVIARSITERMYPYLVKPNVVTSGPNTSEGSGLSRSPAQRGVASAGVDR